MGCQTIINQKLHIFICTMCMKNMRLFSTKFFYKNQFHHRSKYAVRRLIKNRIILVRTLFVNSGIYIYQHIFTTITKTTLITYSYTNFWFMDELYNTQLTAKWLLATYLNTNFWYLEIACTFTRYIVIL